MRSGEIVLVNFQGATGIKRRPALIVSTDAYHESRPDVVLAVITTQTNSATSPTDYLLEDWQLAGLKSPSAYRSYFGTYEQRSLSKVVGKLTERDWLEVKARLRIAISTT